MKKREEMKSTDPLSEVPHIQMTALPAHPMSLSGIPDLHIKQYDHKPPMISHHMEAMKHHNMYHQPVADIKIQHSMQKTDTNTHKSDMMLDDKSGIGLMEPKHDPIDPLGLEDKQSSLEPKRLP